MKIIVGAVVFLLFMTAGSLVGFYTDLLWFREVGFGAVFMRIITVRLGVGAAAGVASALFVWVNLEAARRSSPPYSLAVERDMAEQYRAAVRPHARLLNAGAAAVIGLFTGLSMSSAWERWLLWRNASRWGVTDAQFGRDLSFFVFSIPFQRVVLSWMFGLLIVTLLASLAAHFLYGSVEAEPNRVRVAPVVAVHVSVLLGLFALAKAWAYRLDQFDLVYSPRGTVTGASYTDVHAQLPAFRLLMVIGVVAAIIFFLNIRFRGWLLPAAAVGLWVLASFVVGAIVPAVVQRFVVAPNEPVREEPFIARNIEATRDAFGLAGMNIRRFPAQQSLDEETVEENQGTLRNVRVWDPEILQPTYNRLQALRPYYDFQDVDIDRYTIEGRMTQVMLSARNVNPSGLAQSAQNWVNTRLQYTHGYGHVASPSNAVSTEGRPRLLVSGLPPRGEETMIPEQPGLYFGEAMPSYALVHTKQSEIDFPVGEGEGEVRRTNYEGDGGVLISGLLRRAAFSIRFGDTDLLISDFITEESKVLMRRDVKDRVAAVAPFLRFDHDPYLVAGEDRYYWILDAYTSTDRYPYSEFLDLDSLHHIEQSGGVNYIRNSVKAVVDAYHGTVTLYVVDPSDPLIQAYQRAFPELFTRDAEVPDELRAHFRYPEGLFFIQATVNQLYHITDPQTRYNREDEWTLPLDPVNSGVDSPIPMEPYYVVMKLPGEEREEFLLMIPFTPKDRPNLNAWMAARSDPGVYGELVAFTFPRGTSIEGPQNVQALIEQNADISQQFGLWEGAGSRVDRGALFVLPIGESIIYVEPIYLSSQNVGNALPELRRVIVVVGDNIGFEPTFEASLAKAMAGAPIRAPEDEEPAAPAPDGEPPPSPAPDAPPGDTAALLAEALEHFQRADAALREGDLATYQRETSAARDAVERAQRGS